MALVESITVAAAARATSSQFAPQVVQSGDAPCLTRCRDDGGHPQGLRRAMDRTACLSNMSMPADAAAPFLHRVLSAHAIEVMDVFDEA
jgi:hypothetical protein